MSERERHFSEFATPPYQLVIAVGGKVLSVEVPTREKLMITMTKFAMRLESNERGYFLMLLAELPDRLPHYWVQMAGNWRVSFSGSLGVMKNA